MSRLYTRDGEIRPDISVRETAGGGKGSFKVNEWPGLVNPNNGLTTKQEES